MNILSIETSTNDFSLAVSKNDNVMAFRNVFLKRFLSSSILPSINTILKSSRISLEQIDGFAIGLGPGSFTSLRVGLSTIKALAYAMNKPIVGISSLDVIAMNVTENGNNICTICDAKRNMVYSSLFQSKNGGLIRKGKYILCSIDDVLKKIKKKTIIVGDGIKLFEKQIAMNKNAIFANERDWRPQAKQLSKLAYKKFLKEEFDNIDKLVPLYLYPKDCQVTVRRKL